MISSCIDWDLRSHILKASLGLGCFLIVRCRWSICFWQGQYQASFVISQTTDVCAFPPSLKCHTKICCSFWRILFVWCYMFMLSMSYVNIRSRFFVIIRSDVSGSTCYIGNIEKYVLSVSVRNQHSYKYVAGSNALLTPMKQWSEYLYYAGIFLEQKQKEVQLFKWF